MGAHPDAWASLGPCQSHGAASVTWARSMSARSGGTANTASHRSVHHQQAASRGRVSQRTPLTGRPAAATDAPPTGRVSQRTPALSITLVEQVSSPRWGRLPSAAAQRRSRSDAAPSLKPRSLVVVAGQGGGRGPIPCAAAAPPPPPEPPPPPGEGRSAGCSAPSALVQRPSHAG